MLYPIYGPIAAEPVLHLALQHVARTPTARLGIVYEIMRRRPCPPPCGPAILPPCDCVAANGLRHDKELPPGEVAELIANRSIRAPHSVMLSYGERLYLDSVLAGGVNGEWLPLSISCRMARYQQPAPLGTELNLLM